MDRQEVARAEDEVDLGRRRLAVVAEGEQHGVDDVALERLDLRALVPLGDVLRDERMEPQGVGDDPDLVGARRGKIDPQTRAVAAHELGDVADVR